MTRLIKKDTFLFQNISYADFIKQRRLHMNHKQATRETLLQLFQHAEQNKNCEALYEYLCTIAEEAFQERWHREPDSDDIRIMRRSIRVWLDKRIIAIYIGDYTDHDVNRAVQRAQMCSADIPKYDRKFPIGCYVSMFSEIFEGIDPDKINLVKEEENEEQEDDFGWEGV